jgi:glycerol-3-phosphate dehydrogenase (NAD(P)+)
VKFLTIGHGAWGTAVASILAGAGAGSHLLSFRKDIADEINQEHRNESYLPDLRLNENLIAATPENIPSECDCIIWAIPIQFLRARARSVRDLLPTVSLMINLGKGIELATTAVSSEILSAEFPNVRLLGALAGPNIAPEVVMGKHTEATLALADAEKAARLVACFRRSPLLIRTTSDVRGVEMSGAMKNVAALVGGTADGLDLGVNAKALLIARVWEELASIGMQLGVGRAAFYTVTAIADLCASAYAPGGRNRRVGEQLAKGVGLEAAQRSLRGRIAEGVFTQQALFENGRLLSPKMPILAALFRLMRGEVCPKTYLQSITNSATVQG